MSDVFKKIGKNTLKGWRLGEAPMTYEASVFPYDEAKARAIIVNWFDREG